MNASIPNISFYDFLNKLVPGYLIYNCIGRYPFISADYIVTWKPEFLCFAFVMMASFVLGIVYECLLRAINCCIYLRLCHHRRDDEGNCQCCILNALCCLFGNNDKWLIRIGYQRVYGTKLIGIECDKEAYFAAYYNVERNGCLGNIPILEALSRFCKQIIIPFVLWEICCLELTGCAQCWAVLGNLIGIFILCMISICFQRQICELVWEGDKFLKTQDLTDSEKS